MAQWKRARLTSWQADAAASGHAADDWQLSVLAVGHGKLPASLAGPGLLLKLSEAEPDSEGQK